MLRSILLLLAPVLISITCCAKPVPKTFLEKTIDITVTPKAVAIIGRDTLTFEGMTKELQTRLWKSYLGTGKMPSKIVLQFSGDVLMGTRDAAKDAIKKAQENALTELCLEKYKNRFDAINSHQQSKLKKKFPVLFQKEY